MRGKPAMGKNDRAGKAWPLRYRIGLLFLGLAGIGIPFSASHAATYSNTVGGSIANMEGSFPGLMVFFTGFCLITGVYLVANGLITMKQSQEEHLAADTRFRISSGMLKIAGGAMLVAIPDTIDSGLLTILNIKHYTGGMNRSPGDVQTCLVNADNASAAECVARNVGVNVVPVAMTFLSVGCFVVGGYIIANSIMKFAANNNDGRSPKGRLFAQMAIGLIFCNVNKAMTVIQNTLGVSGGVMSDNGSIITGGGNVPGALTYTPDTSVKMLNQFANTISWGFVIIALFGMIAFIRGVGKLYMASSGQAGPKEISGGLTHMIFGVACTNIKVTTCWVLMSTIGSSLGFCAS